MIKKKCDWKKYHFQYWIRFKERGRWVDRKKTYNFKLKGKTSKWKWLFETWFDFVSFGKKMWNLKLGLGGSGSGKKKKKKREGCSFLIFFFSKNSFYLFNCVFLGPMPDVSFLLATMPCQPRVYDTPSLFLVDC